MAGVNQAFPTLSGFTLPNGESYQFSYDPTYGTLSKIVYPTGGYVRYVWGVNSQSQAGFANGTLPSGQLFGCNYHYDTPVVTDRYVSFDGSTEPLHQHFTYSTTWETGSNAGLYSSKATTVTTTDNLRSASFQNNYTYSPIIVAAQPNTDVAITNQIPLESEIQYYDWSGALLRTVYKSWTSQYTMTCDSTTQGGMTSRADYAYSAYGAQVVDKKEWDWGQAPDCRSASSGTPLRETLTNYQSFADTPIYPAGPSIFDRPSSVTVNYGGSKNAETDYTYDNGVSSVTATQHDNTNYSTSNTTRGNAASQTAKCFQSCANAVTSYTYDETGQTTSMTDPRGNVTSYCYGDQSPGCSSSSTNAYLTQITYPNTGVAHIEKFGYNLASGEVTSAIDENNQTTSYLYNDSLARLTETDYPDTGKTTISYNDSPPSPSVTTSKFLGGSTWATTAVIMDGIGHPKQTQMQTDPPGTDYTDTTHDALGLVWKVSNPYRSLSDPTYGLTTYTYDALGRPSDETGASSIVRPDGSTVSTTYSGNCVTLTDEQSKRRQTCSDGIGRLLSVAEDPNNLNYPTSYAYTYPASNSYGMVFSVTQGSQARTFTYDSLSRLLSTANPESGTTSYTYDADGNVLSKQDARGVGMTYGPYDALNRLEKRTYPDGTTANLFYDEASVTLGSWTSPGLAYPVGRLTHTTTLNSAGVLQTATVQDYDTMGRTKDYRQCTPANCGSSSIWDMNYTYDPAGDVTSWLHPAGYTLTNTINAAQQITAVQSSWVDSNHPAYLAESISYTAWGAVSELVNGCAGSGCLEAQETYTYNNRLQPVMIELGTTGNATADYCLVYNYSLGAANPTSCVAPSVATGNSGNVIGYWYQDNVNGSSFSHTAAYSYDTLNRLAMATATSPGGSTLWSQTYSYDRWGNGTCSGTGLCPSLSYNSQNNNQLASIGSYSFSYDAAGNLLQDPSNYPVQVVHSYQWDGEERVASVDNGSTWGFTYNALGHRAQWAHTGGADQHLFDAEGNWLGVANNYSLVRFGERAWVVYSSSATYFNHVNALGSTSMYTNQDGGAQEDLLFYPWGDVWQSQGTGGYNFAELPYRDVTTTTDITTARFSSPNFARWFSPDPAGKEAVRLDDPQTWNMYAYVRNNPTTLNDPSGLTPPPLDLGDPPDYTADSPTGVYVDTGLLADYSGVTSVENPPASEKPPEQQTATLNLGGVEVEYSPLQPLQFWNGNRGTEMNATAQDCSGCAWAQTVTRTGDPTDPTHTDRDKADQPLYPAGNSPANLWDRPSTHQPSGSGTFTAVSTLGVADADRKTFKVLGSMTWGYAIDSKGSVTTSGPRVSTRTEQARSIDVLKRETPQWTIVH